MAMPRKNMAVMATNSSSARIQCRVSRCPAPGTSQPRISAEYMNPFCLGSSGVCAFVAISNEYTGSKAQKRGSNPHQLSLNPPRHHRMILRCDHVHFAANPKLRQVNSRLNRKACKGQDAPLIVGLQIIQMRAAAVYLGSDVVSRPMREVLPVPRIADDIPRCIIGLKTGDRMP